MSLLNLLPVNCFVNRIMQKETFIFNYLSNSVGFSIFGGKKNHNDTIQKQIFNYSVVSTVCEVRTAGTDSIFSS